MIKTRWVVMSPDSREGEFEFNTKTQDHLCRSLEEARDLITDRDYDYEDHNGKGGYDYPHSRYKIYKITLERVK